MRSRNIKPGFFKNEVLAELPPETRLLFIGLWLLADREGRLEDRPKRIKMELFGYDDYNINEMIEDLQSGGFLIRYCINNEKFIQLENFVKHQDPHYKEKASVIPPPDGRSNFIKAVGITKDMRERTLARFNNTCAYCGATENLCIDHIIPASRGGSSEDDNLQILCGACNTKKGNKLAGEEKGIKKGKHSPYSILTRTNLGPSSGQQKSVSPPDSLIPSSLIPESINTPLPPKGDVKVSKAKRERKPRSATAIPFAEDFSTFWEAYPRKVAKPSAEKAWEKLVKAGELPDMDTLLAAVANQTDAKDWHTDQQFCPHPATWLNGKRWEDDVCIPGKSQDTRWHKYRQWVMKYDDRRRVLHPDTPQLTTSEIDEAAKVVHGYIAPDSYTEELLGAAIDWLLQDANRCVFVPTLKDIGTFAPGWGSVAGWATNAVRGVDVGDSPFVGE